VAVTGARELAVFNALHCGERVHYASNGSNTLRGQDRPLTRQRLVLLFDQVAVALSNFTAFTCTGSEFVGDRIALPALHEESIHGYIS
jgi:hypothetical protein